LVAAAPDGGASRPTGARGGPTAGGRSSYEGARGRRSPTVGARARARRALLRAPRLRCRRRAVRAGGPAPPHGHARALSAPAAARADGALLARRRAGVGRQHARARSRGHAGVAVRLAVAAAHRSVLLGAPFRTRLTGRARVGRAAVLPWFIGAVLVLAARVAQAGTAALDVHAPDQGAGPAPLLRAEAGVA